MIQVLYFYIVYLCFNIIKNSDCNWAPWIRIVTSFV